MDGENAPSANGFTITGGGSTVDGFIINRFTSGVGISLGSSGGNIIAGNFIGTDGFGTAGLGNSDGLTISDSPNNTIGGPAAADRNIISGNQTGIVVTGSGSVGNAILGDYIGVSVNGDAAVSGSGTAISILGGSSATTVGGITPGSGNLISGGPRRRSSSERPPGTPSTAT